MESSTPPQRSLERAEGKPRLARFREALRRADTNAALLHATRATREILFGDELSTAGDRVSQILARHLSEAQERDSAARELGLTALQVWQALSESAGRGRGTEDVAILFTDLVDFSAWALKAGDEVALTLLREVAVAVEPAIKSEHGRIVKRLGDGHMAVFGQPDGAVRAALTIQDQVALIDLDGYRPKLRAGIHCGRPRRLGGDYLGVDVNVAARVAAAARGGEVLVSDSALPALDADALELKRLRRFRAKGAPSDLAVYSVTARPARQDG
jgi:class 3 adenylate cyclase